MFYIMAKDRGNNGTWVHIYVEKTPIMAMDKVSELTDIGYEYVDNIDNFNKCTFPTRAVITFEGDITMLESYSPQDL